MRMLFPHPADSVDPAVVYADMPNADGRPSVRLNMIVSVDGGTSWNGVSGALGGPADKALFATLRSLADAILVASGTMRAEQYGPVVMPEGVQRERRSRGQQPVPAVAVVSSSCRFDWQSPFFSEATTTPYIITVASADARSRERAAEVAEVIIAGDDTVDLTRAVGELGARGAANILAEGGPTLNGELAQAGLLDELCVTLAPLLASGDAKRLIAGSALAQLATLQVRSMCEADEYLFLRYRPVRQSARGS
jgi:riboflavin biosynthesis pyrimidine reductase